MRTIDKLRIVYPQFKWKYSNTNKNWYCKNWTISKEGKEFISIPKTGGAILGLPFLNFRYSNKYKTKKELIKFKNMIERMNLYDRDYDNYTFSGVI